MPVAYRVVGEPQNFPKRTLRGAEAVTADVAQLQEFVAELPPAKVRGYITVFAIEQDNGDTHVDVQTSGHPGLRNALLESLIRHLDQFYTDNNASGNASGKEA